MKNDRLKFIVKYTLIVVFSILIVSCEENVEFKETVQPTLSGFDELEVIESYSMRFNPKANSTITIKLSSGSEYQASKLNAAQTAAVLSIISNERISFDRENEEFVIK